MWMNWKRPNAVPEASDPPADKEDNTMRKLIEAYRQWKSIMEDAEYEK